MLRKTRDSASYSEKHNLRLIKFMVSLLCIVLAFVGGFILRGNDAVLDRLAMRNTSGSGDLNPGMTVSGNTYDSLSARVAEIQGILNKESVDSYDLDATTSNVLNALTSSTNDSFVHYYDATHYATYLKDVSANYAGVGILFSERKGKAFAVDVFNGSEAESVGVQEGDYVVSIDGDRGTDGVWTAAEATKAVTREAGSSVVITFRRPSSPDADGGSEYTVTLSCTRYDEPNVTTELIDSVGYIKLTQITQNSDSLVLDAITDLADSGAQSYVFDIRDNPGGYLTQAVDLASLFVKSGIAVQINTKSAQTNRTVTGNTATDAPLVLLVNRNTAGTAEVLAGALQDNKRATLIGVQSMGKGSVQSVKELSFGGALRYTSAYYLTPLGYTIDKVGIAPDVQVQPGDDDSVDTQKNLAVETAQSLVRE